MTDNKAADKQADASQEARGFAEFPKSFVPNENYGKGIFRRRIRLECEAGQVYGQLEDCNHGFCVTVKHADGKVTDILPAFPRIPFTTCDGAITPLQRLLGCSLEASSLELNMLADPVANCTHLLDLTVLCITNALKAPAMIDYEVSVTDRVDDEAELKVHRNGELMHHWRSRGIDLIWPEAIKGNTLFRGFASWANEHFDGVENEAAFVLQKGNFVSLGRFINVNAMAGSTAHHENPGASCYTYSHRAKEAIRLANTVRDFTDTPEQLLKFL